MLWRALWLVLAGAVLYLAYQAERPAGPAGAPADLPRAGWYLACSVALVAILALFSRSWQPCAMPWLSRAWFWRAILLVGLGCMVVNGIAAWRRTGAPEVVATTFVGVGAILLATWRPTGLRALAALLMAGLTLRLVLIPHTPLAAQEADMLPLIQAAGQNLLRGQSPYRLYDLHTWPLPLTYLPGTWLSYLPTVVLDLDPRLVNVLASAGTVAVLGATTRRSPAVPLVGLLYLLPQVVVFDLYTEMAIFWLVLAVFLAGLAGSRQGLTAVSYGLAVVTSPLALVLGPGWLAFWGRRLPLGRLVGLLALAAGVVAALVLPFLLWSPGEFLYGTVIWFNDPRLAGAGSWLDRNQLYQVGLAGWFWLLGLVDWLRPIQVGVLTLTTVAILRYARDRAGLWVGWLWTYVGFVFFNLIIWPYFYVPALWLAFLSAQEDSGSNRSPGGRAGSRPTISPGAR